QRLGVVATLPIVGRSGIGQPDDVPDARTVTTREGSDHAANAHVAAVVLRGRNRRRRVVTRRPRVHDAAPPRGSPRTALRRTRRTKRMRTIARRFPAVAGVALSFAGG